MRRFQLSPQAFLRYLSIIYFLTISTFLHASAKNDAVTPAAPLSSSKETKKQTVLKKNKVKITSETSSNSFKWHYTLPLGIGNFIEKDYVWGSVFAGSQIIAFGLGAYFYLKSENTFNTAKATLQERANQSATYTDPTLKTAYDNETTAYTNTIQTQYSNENLMANISYGTVAAIWIGNIALLAFSKPKVKKMTTNNLTSRIEVENLNSNLLVNQKEWQNRESINEWNFNLLPALNATSQSYKLDISYHF